MRLRLPRECVEDYLSINSCSTKTYIIDMLFLSASDKPGSGNSNDLHFVIVEIFEEQIRLAPTELTFVPKFRGVLLGDVLARRVPVSALWRYRAPLQ
jgi:hypothetical protein